LAFHNHPGVDAGGIEHYSKSQPIGRIRPPCFFIQEKTMLQKYKMEIDTKKNELTISEFAFIGKQKHPNDSIRPRSDDFLMAHKVTYDLDAVSKAASNGKIAVIDEIRTDVFYPTESCATLIADQVISLIGDGTDQPVEFFFDDRDVLAAADSIN
jgi:hypothetical protein